MLADPDLAYLFDTDAISEVFRKRPAPGYLQWLANVPREAQFTSAVVVGELYRGALRAAGKERHLHNLENRVLSALTVLPFDLETARMYGAIHAELERRGTPIGEADVQIGATALVHGLSVVTGNVRHFEKIPGIAIEDVLAISR